MKKIQFTKGNWEDFFQYAYTERFSFAPKFRQEETCIVNSENHEMKRKYDYLTIMTKEKYAPGTKMRFTTSFENYGAPLVVITDTLRKDEHGNLKYGVCQEFVLWEKGINVWDFFMDGETLKWEMLLSLNFPVASGVIHEMQIEFLEKGVKLLVGNQSAFLRLKNMPEKFYIGITGCEGINRFYDAEFDVLDK